MSRLINTCKIFLIQGFKELFHVLKDAKDYRCITDIMLKNYILKIMNKNSLKGKKNLSKLTTLEQTVLILMVQI